MVDQRLCALLDEAERDLSRIADDLNDDWVDGHELSLRVDTVRRRLAAEAELAKLDRREA